MAPVRWPPAFVTANIVHRGCGSHQIGQARPRHVDRFELPSTGKTPAGCDGEEIGRKPSTRRPIGLTAPFVVFYGMAGTGSDILVLNERASAGE